MILFRRSSQQSFSFQDILAKLVCLIQRLMINFLFAHFTPVPGGCEMLCWLLVLLLNIQILFTKVLLLLQYSNIVWKMPCCLLVLPLNIRIFGEFSRQRKVRSTAADLAPCRLWATEIFKIVYMENTFQCTLSTMPFKSIIWGSFFWETLK